MSKTSTQVTTIGIFVMAAFFLFVFLLISFGGGRWASRTFKYKMYFFSKVRGLKEGSPVMFRGVKLGQVKSVTFTTEDDLKRIMCHARSHGKGGVMCGNLIDDSALTESNSRERFPIEVTIELDPECMGVEQGLWIRLFNRDAEEIQELLALLDEMVCKNGLRGELQTMSLLTGQLYIEMVPHVFEDKHEAERTRVLFSKGVIPVQLSMMEKLRDKLGQQGKKGSTMDNLTTFLVQLGEFVESGKSEKMLNDISQTCSNVNQLTANSNLLVGDTRNAVKQLHGDAHNAVEELRRQVKELSQNANLLMADARKLLERGPVLMDDTQAVLKKLDEALTTMNQIEKRIDVVLSGAFPNQDSGREMRQNLDSLLKESEQTMMELRMLLRAMSADPQMIIMGNK